MNVSSSPKRLRFPLAPVSLFFFLPESNAQSKSSPATTYTNPLSVAFGDPYVLRTKDGKYYMYGTGGSADKGFAAYSSTELINWKDEGQVWHFNNPNGWSDTAAAWGGPTSATTSLATTLRRQRGETRRGKRSALLRVIGGLLRNVKTKQTYAS